MWYIDWFDDLVFGNESLLAYMNAACRSKRPATSVKRSSTSKHIITRCAINRAQSTAAKDG